MHDAIVIGSGPAGYTAALYTSRAFLKTLLFTGITEGGQLTTTTEVDNYPGFAKGILGPDLMLAMKEQVVRFGTEVVATAVVRIEKTGSVGEFDVTSDGKTYQGKTIIIATGASALYLGLPSEDRLMGKGVSACATCDGFFFRGKEVVVIGGGDTAMEEATFLTTFATKVTIIHRRNEFRASAIMLDRARKNPKITFLTNQIVMEVLGEGAVSGVRLKDATSGTVSDYPTQGVFLAIGHKPNTEFLKGFLPLDPKGYIQTLPPITPLTSHTQTTIPGVFAAGDCVDPRYRQAVVAAGAGCMAAIDAQRWLSEEK